MVSGRVKYALKFPGARSSLFATSQRPTSRSDSGSYRTGAVCPRVGKSENIPSVACREQSSTGAPAVMEKSSMAISRRDKHRIGRFRVFDFATLKVCPSAMQLDIPRMFASRISGGAVVAAIRLYARVSSSLALRR